MNVSKRYRQPFRVHPMKSVIDKESEKCMARRLSDLRPAWAMGSADDIAKLPVLGVIEQLTIFRGSDETGAHDRVCECGDRWYSAGRHALFVDPPIGKDNKYAILGAA